MSDGRLERGRATEPVGMLNLKGVSAEILLGVWRMAVCGLVAAKYQDELCSSPKSLKKGHYNV